jgi:hypothetical protein
VIAVHPLMVLVAFTLAALVTYAVVLGALTAVSAVGEETGDETLDAELGDGFEVEDEDARRPARAAVPC